MRRTIENCIAMTLMAVLTLALVCATCALLPCCENAVEFIALGIMCLIDLFALALTLDVAFSFFSEE